MWRRIGLAVFGLASLVSAVGFFVAPEILGFGAGGLVVCVTVAAVLAATAVVSVGRALA